MEYSESESGESFLTNEEGMPFNIADQLESYFEADLRINRKDSLGEGKFAEGLARLLSIERNANFPITGNGAKILPRFANIIRRKILNQTIEIPFNESDLLFYQKKSAAIQEKYPLFNESEEMKVFPKISNRYLHKHTTIEGESVVKYLFSENNTEIVDFFFKIWLNELDTIGQKTSIKKGVSMLSKVYEGKKLRKGVCGRELSHPNVGYRCVDCQKSNACIICRECFEKSDHTNHRVEVRQAYNGMCDCGDVEVWDPKGNCSEHPGYLTEDNYMSSDLKLGYIKAIQLCLSALLIEVELLISDSELSEEYAYKRELNSRIRNILSIAMTNIELLFDVFGLIHDSYPSMAVLTSRALIEPLSTNLRSNQDQSQFYHDCSSTSLKGKISENPHSCTCSILEIIFRYSTYLVKYTHINSGFLASPNKKSAIDLTKFYLSMFVIQDFKIALASSFMKYLEFSINWEKDVSPNSPTTRIAFGLHLDIAFQVFTSVEATNIAMQKAGPSPLLRWFLLILEEYSGVFDDLFEKVYYDVFDVLMRKEVTLTSILDDQESTELLLKIQELSYRHLVYFDPENPSFEIGNGLQGEITMEGFWIKNIQKLGLKYVLRSEKYILEKYLVVLKNSIMRKDANLINEFQSKAKHASNYLSVERIFIIALVQFLQFQRSSEGQLTLHDLDLIELENLSNKLFSSDIERGEFWRSLTIKIAGSFGFYRELNNRLWAQFAHLAENIPRIYRNRGNPELDIIGLQLCALSSKQSEFFSHVYHSFFQHPVSKLIYQGGIKNALQKHREDGNEERADRLLVTISNYFKLILDICHADYPLLLLFKQVRIFLRFSEMISTINDSENEGFIGEGPVQAREDFILNILACHSSISIKDLKAKCSRSTLDHTVLREYGDINKAIQSIRLKDEHQKTIEKKILKGIQTARLRGYPHPNILWHDPQFTSDISERCGERFKENIDTLIWSEPRTSLTKYLSSTLLREDSFLEALFADIIEISQTESLDQFESYFLLLLLKLDAQINHDRNKAEKLRLNISEFINTLKDSLAKTSYYSLFMKKFKAISKRIYFNNQEDEKQNEEQHDNAKSSLIKRKKEKMMKKMQSKFEKKKMKFFENFETTMNEMLEEKDERELNSCIICSEKIQVNESCLLNAEIQGTNAWSWAQIQTLQKLPNKSQEIIDMIDALIKKAKSSTSYLFNTCSHTVHYRCQKEIAKGGYRVYSDDEMSCPLCKSPFNCFIILTQNFEECPAQMQSIDHQDFMDLLNNIIEGNGIVFNADSGNFAALYELTETNKTLLDDLSTKMWIFNDQRNSIKEACGLRVDYEFEAANMLANSIIYACQLSELLGFNIFLVDVALQYSLLLKNLRMVILNERKFNKDKEGEIHQLKLEELKNSLALLFRSSDEDFMNLDIDDLMLNSLVNSCFIVFNSIDLDRIILILSKLFISAKIKQLELIQKEDYSQNNLILDALIKKCACFYILLNYHSVVEMKQNKAYELFIKMSLRGENTIEEQKLLLGYLGINSISNEHFENVRKQLPKDILVNENHPSTVISASRILAKFNKIESFAFINLEDNFQVAFDSYLFRKCDGCGQKPYQSHLYVCLICGELMCGGKCNGQVTNLNFKGLKGNLCNHTNYSHGGQCLFLDVCEGTYICYDGLRFYIFTGIYTDIYGMLPKDNPRETPQFEYVDLDPDHTSNLKQIYIKAKIIQKIIQKNISDNSMQQLGGY